MRQLAIWAALALSFGCAHSSIVPADLERFHRPAFISRIEENAGPRSRVFRDDPHYVQTGRLQRLEPREADRRLQIKLGRALTRFQVSEGLRAAVQALLPKEAPWSQAVPPAQVATTLESFLVEEVPANAPDYELLRPLGVDAVLEMVMQDYGMRSEGGRAQVYLRGYARLFLLGGAEIWRHDFRRDNVEAKALPLDPFEVAKLPDLFRDAFGALLESSAEELVQSLGPSRLATPRTEPPLSTPPPPRNLRPRLPEDEL